MRGIDHHDRMLLVRAQVLGKTDGVVLVLTRPAAVLQVTDRLRAIGAEILAHFDEVGYLRVRLPLGQFARARILPDVIEARIDAGQLTYDYDQGTDPAAIKLVDHLVDVTRPKFDTATALPAMLRLTASGASGTPNPYVPMADMGSPQFTRAHPSYDGRGVTIGVLESGVLDFTHSAVQGARLLGGDSAAKVIGIITPSSDDSDPEPGALATVLTRDSTPNQTRVRSTGPIQAEHGTFSFDGRSYYAPHAGRFSVGRYTGYQPIPGGPYTVLWDSAGHVWVDTNRNRDFRDEAPVEDFNRTHTIGYLRRDSTAAKPERSVPFAVGFDSGGTALHLYEGVQSHQTMVASVAAGHGLMGKADASAPGAQLVIVDAGQSLGDAMEGFIRAARDPRIDLITSSQTGETFPGSGESIFSLVLERLVHVYHKPIFAAAGNTGPGLSLSIEPGNAPGVIGVGGYVGRDTYLAHYGWHLTSPDWLVPYSGRGPTLDGAMKPDLLAPVLSIAAAPCSENEAPARYLVYTLPPCYMLGSGTSSATPHAAGAAALLISAAKQVHVAYDAARLTWALRTAARPLRGYGVNEQGGGLIDVRKTWDLLRSRIEVAEIRASGPVRTRLNPYLRQPGVGRGLYEREGWAPGDTGTRTITLTRTSGRPGAMTYGLQWRGNDGTFQTAATQVILSLNEAVDVRVHIAPRTAGVHSAALQVVDRPSGVAVQQVLATVVAAHQLTAANSYTVRLRGNAEWPRPMPFFVNVPPGTSALRVEMLVGRGRLQLITHDPATLDQLAWNTYFKGYKYPFSHYAYVTAGQKGTELVPSPIAGVWELTASPVADPSFGGDSVQYRVPGEVELVVSAVGVTASAAADSTAGRQALTFTNNWAPLTGAATVASLGARRVAMGTVDSSMASITDSAAAAGRTYAIQVDSGAGSLRVAVEPTSDTLAQLDLYLFDCTAGPCYLWDVDFVHGMRAELLVRAPRPGLWTAVVDPARVPSGTTGYRYTEVLTNPMYGSVTVDTAAVPRAAGARWTAEAVVHAGAPVPARRELVTVAEVVDQRAEAEERTHPLAVFGGPRYRPVAVGTAVVPVREVR
jgi:hypothetical protein